MTAGGPSFDDGTRAGAEKFGPNQPPHRLHAPARSPPRHREVPEGGRTGGLHSAAEACGVPPNTVQYAKMRCVRDRIRTRVWCVKKKSLPIRPNDLRFALAEFQVNLHWCKVQVEAPVARVL